MTVIFLHVLVVVDAMPSSGQRFGHEVIAGQAPHIRTVPRLGSFEIFAMSFGKAQQNIT